MKIKRFALALCVLLPPVVLLVSVLPHSITPSALAQQPVNDSDAVAAPVEDDMHEFMEYVFQPTYRRLRSSMAASPKDKGIWTSIKSDSLILAESGNLLLIRGPKADSKDWDEHAIAVRDFGGQLYRAAKKKDDTESQKTYRSMLDNCNACHQQFADGEHQLTP